MFGLRRRFIMMAAVGLVAAWVMALGGYHWAQRRQITAVKVHTFLQEINLAQLTGEARAQALRELAAKLNALSPEERRKVRFDAELQRWFGQMQEGEKGAFIEATLPTGVKQMLNAFEQLPEDKRKRTIELAFKRLQEAEAEAPADAVAEHYPLLTDERLRQKAVKTGLSTYYSQSSAQTKAELAPLLEEMQRVMESGRALRPLSHP